MVRLTRGADTFDVWIEGEQLRGSSNGGAPHEVEISTTFNMPGRLSNVMLERLVEGWQRVRDPVREIDVDDEPRNAALEAALIADLGDADAALVYADWYQQQQHPRGDLIAAQVARARGDSAELQELEAGLFADWDAYLRGPIHKPRDSYELGIDLEWQNGFIRAARIDGKQYPGHADQLLWELLRHPSARLMRELVIGCHSYGDQDNRSITALLLQPGPKPPLRMLVLADFDDTNLDSIDISRAWLGDLTGLSEAFPLLEDVVLKGRGHGAIDESRPHAGLAGLALPHARRFAFRTSGFRKAMLEAVAVAPWPALVELELWLGTTEYGMDCEPADLDLLLRAPLPKLRVLRLMNVEFLDDVIPRLIAFVHAHPLDELDLSLGTLTETGATQLIADASSLSRVLGKLRVHENCLSPAALANLRGSPLTIDDAAPYATRGWYQGASMRIGGQKQNRYVTVSE